MNGVGAGGGGPKPNGAQTVFCVDAVVDGQVTSWVLSWRSKRAVVGREPQPGVGGRVPQLAPLLNTEMLEMIREFVKPGNVPWAGFCPSGQPPAVMPSPAL